MKIDKEITKTINKNKEQFVDFAEQAKQLLLTEANKETECLNSIGLNHHINVIQTVQGQEIERKNFEEKYKDKIISLEEIKAIACKYDLKFLRAKNFIGKVDRETGLKVAKFFEENKNELGRTNEDNFFIMAPPGAFALQGNTSEKARLERERISNEDPALFYKIPGKDYFVYIHKWGKDFTFWRKIRGLYFKSNISMLFFPSIVLFFILELGIKLSVPDISFENTLLTLLLLPICVGLGSVFTFCLVGETENWDDHYSTNATWNSIDRRSSIVL